MHFYKLQFFSLFLNFGIFIIILIINLCNYFLHKSCEPHIFVLFPCRVVFYCLEYIYGKKVILFGYISVYLLMILTGIIKLFLLIIVTIILFVVNKDYFAGIPLLFSSTKFIIILIFFIIIEFFIDLSMWIIIDRFSPNHTPLMLIIEELVVFINSLITKQEYNIMGWDLYVRIYLYIISFIGVLMHNEIIVINYCELGSDTKYFLELKLENEEDYIKADNPEKLIRFETLSEMEDQPDGDVSN